MKLLCAMLFALLMPFGATRAALLSADSPLGPGTGVVDTNTGWEWLQLSAARSLSIQQVLDATAPGGMLSDFHYASRAEEATLIDGYLRVGCLAGCPEIVVAVRYFFGHFGINLMQELGIDTYLEPNELNSTDPGIYSTRFIWYTFPPKLYFDTQRLTLTEARLNDTGPHWIVREAQLIPEPSTATLLSLGVGVCAALWQRRRNLCGRT
ncbi:PEP-CTERM sorting domain-containing protein [Noviherbaspirillum pedocola]|uniref:PEP-CTERM sorting domain-containing protein n=1 Tax=Noviherbaspirillum pedocola TaxID=2801341 RepID=A0A934W506_9BURK|nr:PEP-CTERM sorting domain-containing protein [Noviherbaspirillum pedocola]MBK4739106.1 PEP-CTERM sorting domain-containing protein [Noviherbaspirillum pedocola]